MDCCRLPGFPGLLTSSSKDGLQLESLVVGGKSGKEEWSFPAVEFKAEFTWARNSNGNATEAHMALVEIFLITLNEKTREQTCELIIL